MLHLVSRAAHSQAKPSRLFVIMPGMEFIPLILFGLLLALLGGLIGIICSLFGTNQLLARKISFAGLIFAALQLFICVFVFWHDFNHVALAWLACPTLSALVGIALTYRPKNFQKPKPEIQRLKRFLLIFSLACLFCISVYLLSLGLGKVDGAATSRIKPGMAKSEVLQILGKPQHGEPEDSLWEYYEKGLGLTAFMSPFCIEFNNVGRVDITWVD